MLKRIFPQHHRQKDAISMIRCAPVWAIIWGVFFSGETLNAQPTIPPPAVSDVKPDPLLGKLVMPIAGAKLRREEKQMSLRDVPAPFVVRKAEGNWLWIGRAWIKRSEVVPIEKSLEYYTDWIAKNPKDSWAYDFRGTVFHERGNLDRALEDHSKAIELSPKDSQYYNNRGLVHFEK
jgi:tetratricopeptide (TPR) repeat protein